MYRFGQVLDRTEQFLDHMEHGIPVQVYYRKHHMDIGFIQGISRHFIKIGGLYYSRKLYVFISRPGY
ncbi:MAG: hypothetical protein K0R57_5205 [Paenibacillaceae bacterium]|nr:hypothetical protein [Paenibacillaceae bacterium]